MDKLVFLAYSASVGYKVSADSTYIGDPVDCNILITAKGNTITIDSKTPQIFHSISYKKDDVCFIMYCSDSEGINCNVGICKYEKGIFLTYVEYSDIVVYYVCIRE